MACYITISPAPSGEGANLNSSLLCSYLVSFTEAPIDQSHLCNRVPVYLSYLAANIESDLSGYHYHQHPTIAEVTRWACQKVENEQLFGAAAKVTSLVVSLWTRRLFASPASPNQIQRFLFDGTLATKSRTSEEYSNKWTRFLSNRFDPSHLHWKPLGGFVETLNVINYVPYLLPARGPSWVRSIGESILRTNKLPLGGNYQLRVS